VLTSYVLDRNSALTPVLSETDSGGNTIANYVYGPGLVSRIDAGGNVRYYHFDSRGSTIALSDATGRILEPYAYDPYGKPINQVSSTNRFRYLGRHGVMDEANGFLYFHSRYYSTEAGRFITKAATTGMDGNSQSLNQYIFALNNPVTPSPYAGDIKTTSLNVINPAGNGVGSESCNPVTDLLP
jgi:RHS repeat-associated protein